MKIRILSFTDRGETLARKLAGGLGGLADRGISASEWTAAYFASCNALIFVGAAGIAVRSIAPHLKHKASDPAVVVVDEGGRYAIPILSGHLGGANDLAKEIGRLCGAVPVITTATDIEGRFTVDEWARRQKCAIPDPDRILGISSSILRGQTITVTSDWPITGECPPGVQTGPAGNVRLSLTIDRSGALHLVPRIAVLGVGCKRDTCAEAIEKVFASFLEANSLSPLCITKVCSIDRKAHERGLLSFCEHHGWAFETFHAQALAEVPGSFTSSGFVMDTVGVDNVCERAAVLGCEVSDIDGTSCGASVPPEDPQSDARSRGTLFIPKYARDGVTFALAVRPYAPDWRWQYE